MSLTAFVLIALHEAKDICEAQVNVSVPALPSPPSPPPPTTHPPEVRCCFQAISSAPNALTVTTAAIIVSNIYLAIKIPGGSVVKNLPAMQEMWV